VMSTGRGAHGSQDRAPPSVLAHRRRFLIARAWIAKDAALRLGQQGRGFIPNRHFRRGMTSVTGSTSEDTLIGVPDWHPSVAG
jgi:hypothetical protein